MREKETVRNDLSPLVSLSIYADGSDNEHHTRHYQHEERASGWFTTFLLSEW